MVTLTNSTLSILEARDNNITAESNMVKHYGDQITLTSILKAPTGRAMFDVRTGTQATFKCNMCGGSFDASLLSFSNESRPCPCCDKTVDTNGVTDYIKTNRDNIISALSEKTISLSPTMINNSTEYRDALNIKISFAKITPNLARSIMVFCNHGNRPMTPRNINTLSRAIVHGEWDYSNAEMVRFDKNGELADAQHRCGSVINTNTAIGSFVSIGHNTDSKKTIDTGSARKSRDVLAIEHPSYNSHQSANIARAISSTKQMAISNSACRSSNLKYNHSNTEVVAYHDVYGTDYWKGQYARTNKFMNSPVGWSSKVSKSEVLAYFHILSQYSDMSEPEIDTLMGDISLNRSSDGRMNQFNGELHKKMSIEIRNNHNRPCKATTNKVFKTYFMLLVNKVIGSESNQKRSYKALYSDIYGSKNIGKKNRTSSYNFEFFAKK